MLTHANGVTTALTYHPHGPIDTITAEDPSSSLLHLLDYTVDAVLNVDTITETRGAGSPELFDYAYDGVDRLIQAQLPTAYGLPAQEDFGYDDAGNREDPADPAAYAYDANNRIQAGPASTAWTFDADGNVATRTVSGVEERFTFDRTNRLRAWERGPVGSPTATASYRYDPFGRRLEKTVDGVTTWFLWDGDALLAEFDASGARTRRYTYAGGFAPVEVADPTGPGTEAVYAVDTDHLDTPRLLTDATGAPVWRASTQAYGEAAVDPASTVSFNVRFPGQYLDAETGLHYNRWRYYSPQEGRYISADPIGQLGGPNLYAYAGHNPLAIFDPLGLRVHYQSARVKRGVAEARADWKAHGLPDPLDSVEDADVDVYVAEAPDAEADEFYAWPNSATLYWDPDTGLLVPAASTVDGQGGILSPAQCLYHEARHAEAYASDPAGFWARSHTPDPDYGTAEERRATTGAAGEHEYSERAGGPKRSDHDSGTAVPTTGVRSNTWRLPTCAAC